MKHALKYFSSRNVPSLRPNGVCFLTQSGKNIVLLKWKMTTMKNDVLSFTLHCCPITFSSARTNLCNIGMCRVSPVSYLLYQKVCEHFLISSPWKYQKTNLWALNFTQALTIRNCCLSIQLSSFHTLDFMSSQGTFYLNLKANVYTHFLHINFFHKKCQESLEIWHGDGSCMYKWTVTYNFLAHMHLIGHLLSVNNSRIPRPR